MKDYEMLTRILGDFLPVYILLWSCLRLFIPHDRLIDLDSLWGLGGLYINRVKSLYTFLLQTDE